MKNNCCVQVTQIGNGYHIEITGDKVKKGHCSTIKNSCGNESDHGALGVKFFDHIVRI